MGHEWLSSAGICPSSLSQAYSSNDRTFYCPDCLDLWFRHNKQWLQGQYTNGWHFKLGYLSNKYPKLKLVFPSLLHPHRIRAMLAGIFNTSYSCPCPAKKWIHSSCLQYPDFPKRLASLKPRRIMGGHACRRAQPADRTSHDIYLLPFLGPSLLVEIRTMFVDHTLRGGAPSDPKTRKRLLEAEAWVDSNTMGRRHVWCLGCRKRVEFFQDDFDLREWQRHRDSCFGITDRMKKAVVKEIFWQNCQKELAQCVDSV
ncbi:hypothetical protein F5146DRAFT_1003404 [Armillaria mellea]|nr:hypothetical protein F5146DRAFT_1003404 [Armillaria mellea]